MQILSKGMSRFRRSAWLCPYCKNELGEERPTECPDCRTRHHIHCWEQFGRCSVFGCSGGKGFRKSDLLMVLPSVIFSTSLLINLPDWLHSLLLIPSSFLCFSFSAYFLLSIVEDGLLKNRLSRRSIRRYMLFFLWSVLPFILWITLSI